MEPRLARRLALSALAAGAAADLLFDRVPLGVNWPIAVAIGVAAVAVLRPKDRAIDGLDLWIPAVAILAALGVGLRSDPSVALLDIGLSFVALVAWAVAVSIGGLTRRGAFAIGWLGVRAAMLVGLGSALVLGRVAARDTTTGEAPPPGEAVIRRPAAPILRGLLLAVPVLLVFVALLASADALFASLAGRLLDLPLDPADLVRRAILVAMAAWFIGGGLVVAAGATGIGAAVPAALDRSPGAGFRVLRGATEVLVVLVAVDVLFVLFVGLQAAVLFGGPETVRGLGLTYSEYARQGFFQLIAVVALAGLVLLAAEASARGSRAYVPAALVLIASTAVILVSAAVRLGLYLGMYGWSELRFFAVVAIGWLAVALGLAAVLLLRDRMGWILHGLAMSAAAAVLVVTAIGPQAFVTRMDLDRVLDPRLVPAGGETGLDVDYLATFDADAIPMLVDALPRLDAATQARLKPALLEVRTRLRSEADAPPQGFNLARTEALAALDSLR